MNWTQQNLQNFNKTKGLKSLNPRRATAEMLATNTSTNDKTGTKWMPNDGTWSKNPYVPEEEQSNKLDQTLFS